MPRWRWPDHDQASVDEDVAGLREVLTRHAPDLRDPVLERMAPWLQSFMPETMPPIRDGDLPVATTPMDFTANNLVYADEQPVLVDPDNAEYAPRLLDLAMTALLFHNEEPAAPARLFTGLEWQAFCGGYTRHVSLTATERALWTTAVRYMILEWSTWTLIDAGESDDWTRPGQREFLRDLAVTEDDRYTLPS